MSKQLLPLLRRRRDELDAISPDLRTWSNIREWHVTARPLIAERFTNQLDAFDVIIDIRWKRFVKVSVVGSSRKSGAHARERQARNRQVQTAHAKLLAHIDALIELHEINSDEEHHNDLELHRIITQGESESDQINDETSVDVVIITALKREKEAVLRHLGPGVPVATKSRQYHRLSIPSDDGTQTYTAILLSLPGMGNVQAGIATTQAIDVWNPRLVLLCGITAGISEKDLTWDSKWLGDLLVADQVLAYEPGKLVDGVIERRYEVLRPAFHLVEASRKLPAEKWVLSAKRARPDGSSERVLPKVHIGVVASGEKVIADAGFAEDIKTDWSQLAGVEMEGYGTALAAYQAETAPGMLLVKGICDWADSEKNDEWQEYAADISATFASALLKHSPFPARHKAQAAREEKAQYSGKAKIILNRRIGDDWQELADYFEIPTHKQKVFRQGSEMRGIWEWLEARGKLDGFEEGLAFIERSDLVKILRKERND